MFKFINKNQIDPCLRVIEDKENNTCFANPPIEIQKQFGYGREFIDTPYPETPDGYYRTYEYTDTDPIVKVWSKPIPVESEVLTDES